MKILIISAGRYPVPATKGGAVSTLVEHFVKDNEEEKLMDLQISSPYEERAYIESQRYVNTTFKYIKVPYVLRKAELLAYKIGRMVFSKKNLTQLNSAFSFLWFVFKNAIHLKKSKYDYVIIENTARLFWCFKLFGNNKKYQGKVIYHLHNEPKKLGGCREEIVNCKKIFCISEFIKNSICSSGSPIFLTDKNKAVVLKNCIDINAFSPLYGEERKRIRESYGFNDSDRVILFSGRIDAEKGIKQVLEAFKYVKTENVKLLIVGSSFYGMSVKNAFEMEIINTAKLLGNKVVFTGFLPYTDMPKAYNASDIVVLPSMWDEPAGLTIIEAMSCEKPVITTISGGIPEYTNEKCSILLNRDVEIDKKIADSIDFLFENSAYANEMARNARRHVVENFNAKQYLKKAKGCLEEGIK